MTKFLILLMMFLVFGVAAQEQPVIHATYPEGQDFYTGSKAQLYRDINRILLDHKFTRCDEPTQTYTASVLVRQDSRVSFVKDFDSVNISENKCAYDLFRKVLPNLKNWKPATIEGKAVNAIAQVTFVYNDLFENYRDGYYYTEEAGLPEFPGGIHAFRQEFTKHFNTSVLGTGIGTVSIELTFVVGMDGQIEDVKAVGNNARIANEAVRTMSRIKTRWKPATANGLPVRYRFRLPIKMNA